MANLLKVEAVLLGASFGRTVIKYKAANATNHALVLEAINQGLEDQKYAKKYFLPEDLNDVDLGVELDGIEVVKVTLPLEKVPNVGDTILIRRKSKSSSAIVLDA